jgi:hypothetical protein
VNYRIEIDSNRSEGGTARLRLNVGEKSVAGNEENS